MIKDLMRFIVVLLIPVLVFNGCVDNEFDEPPFGGEDPVIPGDQITSLDEVFQQQIPGENVKLDIKKYVQAVVVADDESGNFFRTIIIEDENSDRGIALLIDEVELYNTYPVGRRVFVDLTDLYLGDYNGLPQLGAEPYDDDGFLRLGGIQSELAKSNVVLPGVYNLTVEPKVTNINLLGNMALNTLIKVENVQFKGSSAGVTYAIANPPTGVNHTLGDCEGNEILMRTSGFADFAQDITPDNNGSITAVYGVFGSERQLLIRNTEDVQFDQPRCETPTIPISTLRSNYNQGSTTAPSGVIMGTVISDYTTANVNTRNVFIQDESAGILIRFSGNHSYALGSQLMIDVSGQELSEFRELLQVNNVPNSNVEVVGVGDLPEAQEVTVSEIMANFEDYESELVKITNATISGGSTFSGGLDVNDGTGTIELFTQFGATFADDPVPSGQVSVTAIVSVFDDPQIIINGSSDVVGGGSTGGDLINISALRDAFAGGSGSAPEGYIQGVVISDRSTMNINGRNLFIQDASAGIVVRFSGDHDFNTLEEIRVTVTGLELSEFNGLLQVNNVPNSNATSIGTASLPTPEAVSVNDLVNDIDGYESRLIQLTNVTLSGSSTFSGSVNVTDASGTIQMFTGGSATFANSALPEGEVDIVVIASQFNDPQVVLRNLSDIDGGGNTGGGDLSIMSLREAYNSGSSSAPAGTIEGIVISDFASENTTGRNLHIQDETGGITLRFVDFHEVPMGTKLKVDVSGLELSEFRGLLQVTNVPNGNASDMGIVDLPEPQVITIAQIISDLEILESTLVRVNDVTLSGSDTWNGNITITDASGNIMHFTRSAATFANSSVTTGEVDVIAMVTQFDAAQLTIRNLDDIIN